MPRCCTRWWAPRSGSGGQSWSCPPAHGLAGLGVRSVGDASVRLVVNVGWSCRASCAWRFRFFCVGCCSHSGKDYTPFGQSLPVERMAATGQSHLKGQRPSRPGPWHRNHSGPQGTGEGPAVLWRCPGRTRWPLRWKLWWDGRFQSPQWGCLVCRFAPPGKSKWSAALTLPPVHRLSAGTGGMAGAPVPGPGGAGRATAGLRAAGALSPARQSPLWAASLPNLCRRPKMAEVGRGVVSCGDRNVSRVVSVGFLDGCGLRR